MNKIDLPSVKDLFLMCSLWQYRGFGAEKIYISPHNKRMSLECGKDIHVIADEVAYLVPDSFIQTSMWYPKYRLEYCPLREVVYTPTVSELWYILAPFAELPHAYAEARIHCSEVRLVIGSRVFMPNLFPWTLHLGWSNLQRISSGRHTKYEIYKTL